VDGKVKTSTLANLTHLPHGHVAAVMGTLRKLRLDALIDPEPSTHRNAVLAM
jgi:hypothetical protein